MDDQNPENSTKPFNPGINEAETLLSGWRAERAFRVGRRMAPIGSILAILAVTVDIYFGLPRAVILGDVVLLVGCVFSLYLSKPKTNPSILVWAPMYFGVWLACSVGLWVTGGLQSPFIGTFLSLLCVSGLVVQSQMRSSWVVVFIFLNLVFWMALDALHVTTITYNSDSAFVALVNGISLLALLVCIFQFLRTERELAREILGRYHELAITRSDLAREEAASSAKSTFLANISHELRTPLSAILGYAELLQDGELTDLEKEQFLETILRNGQTLQKLVNDLLDLSKIEAGKIEIEKTEMNPKEILREVIELFMVAAQKKGLDLRLTQENQIPVSLVSDPLRFRQILNNLVGNAIKFTEKGTIEIRASISERAFKLEVIDSGRGLSADERKRLFKPFSQAAPEITRNFGGTGLGLSLSRSLAQHLGGELHLSWSELGVGSCFIFSHPLTAQIEKTGLVG